MSVTRPARRPVVLLAYAAFVLVGLSAGVGGVLLPAQIDDYGVDKATIGITFFTFSAGFLLAGITTGGLIDRLGTRAALAVGGGAFVLASLYTALRPPFLALVAVQVVAGYGIGVLESVLNAHLSELTGATTLLNRLHAFFGVGALLAPALAAWMLRSLPWTAVWLVLALAGLPLVVGFLLAYPKRRGPDSGGPAAAGGAAAVDAPPPGAADAAGRPGNGGLLVAALRQPAVVLAAVFLAVYVGLEISVGNWGFSLLVGGYDQSEVLAGYAVSGYWLGLTAGRFLISPLATRAGLTPAATSAGCLVGVIVSAVLGWAVPVAAVASVALVLLGFFLGPLFPTAMAMVPRLTASRLVPTAIGVLNGVSVIGGAVFPWLAGAIAQGVGVWTLLPFAVVLAIGQLAIWWRLARQVAAADRAGRVAAG
ncbi:MFS transporter [Plantactinospora sp. KLBMP9567]|uniref:MFS transporter n=1 Tax=Plantactinospora sp. KLBMP9567 TaxID=3085900 RepID=UPI002980B878|nr:MFS transporter [Plantactinospora sp. KLBMP9567]MDW5325926.1 MFS transporter [Plantactinospora sp. KLBMP9567]